jgi:hypothetical protein
LRGGCVERQTIEFGNEVGGFDVCAGGHESILRGVGGIEQGDGAGGRRERHGVMRAPRRGKIFGLPG